MQKNYEHQKMKEIHSVLQSEFQSSPAFLFFESDFANQFYYYLI